MNTSEVPNQYPFEEHKLLNANGNIRLEEGPEGLYLIDMKFVDEEGEEGPYMIMQWWSDTEECLDDSYYWSCYGCDSHGAEPMTREEFLAYAKRLMAP